MRACLLAREDLEIQSRRPTRSTSRSSGRHLGQVPPVPDDSPAALAKRKGAAKGGKGRAAKLTPEERSKVAKKAAKARWTK